MHGPGWLGGLDVARGPSAASSDHPLRAPDLLYADDRNQILAKSFTAVPRLGPSVTAMLVPLPGDRRSRELTHDVRTDGRDEKRLKMRFAGPVPEPTAELSMTADINSALLELYIRET